MVKFRISRYKGFKVGIFQIFSGLPYPDLSKLLCLSLLPAKMKKIQSKMKALEC